MGDDGDETFDQYEVTTINPGGYLMLFTGLFCLSCFLVGICAMPGIFLYPLWRKCREVCNGMFAEVRDRRDLDDDCIEMAGAGEDMFSYETMPDGENKDSNDSHIPSVSSAYQALDDDGMAGVTEEADIRPQTSDDWIEVNDSTAGQVYYYNTQTMEMVEKKEVEENVSEEDDLMFCGWGRPTSKQEVAPSPTGDKVYRQVLGRDSGRARQANSLRNIVDDEGMALSLQDFAFKFERKRSSENFMDNPIAERRNAVSTAESAAVQTPEKNTIDSNRVWEETRKIIELGTP